MLEAAFTWRQSCRNGSRGPCRPLSSRRVAPRASSSADQRRAGYGLRQPSRPWPSLARSRPGAAPTSCPCRACQAAPPPIHPQHARRRMPPAAAHSRLSPAPPTSRGDRARAARPAPRRDFSRARLARAGRPRCQARGLVVGLADAAACARARLVLWCSAAMTQQQPRRHSTIIPNTSNRSRRRRRSSSCSCNSTAAAAAYAAYAAAAAAQQQHSSRESTAAPQIASIVVQQQQQLEGKTAMPVHCAAAASGRNAAPQQQHSSTAGQQRRSAATVAPSPLARAAQCGSARGECVLLRAGSGAQAGHPRTAGRPPGRAGQARWEGWLCHGRWLRACRVVQRCSVRAEGPLGGGGTVVLREAGSRGAVAGGRALLRERLCARTAVAGLAWERRVRGRRGAQARRGLGFRRSLLSRQ